MLKINEEMYVKEWISKGQMLSADAMLYLFNEKSGDIVLVQPNPEGFNLLVPSS